MERPNYTYSCCGNVLGLIPLIEAGYPPEYDFKSDEILRQDFRDWGRQIKSDSIMVLLGDPDKFPQQGYHYQMYVFEPMGCDDSGLAGGISTMCGNGIRAAASYIEKKIPGTVEAVVKTLSGLRTVRIENGLFTVNMGEFTCRDADLSKYVNTRLVLSENGYYLDSPIPQIILEDLSKFINCPTWSIGLNGDRVGNEIDGEPHVVIDVSNQISDIFQLRRLAIMVGPIVSKNLDLFPREINANFISVVKQERETIEIMNCTHERNLGDDPEHSTTMSCGTGSTVAGGFILKRHPEVASVLVRCSGGDLVILRGLGDNLFMTGPAEEVK